jgi:hypothetical protein
MPPLKRQNYLSRMRKNGEKSCSTTTKTNCSEIAHSNISNLPNSQNSSFPTYKTPTENRTDGEAREEKGK